LPIALGIAAAAAVAGGDVEITVRPKGELAAVVVAKGLAEFEYDVFAVGIGCIGGVGADAKMSDDGAAGRRGRIVDI